MKRTAIFLTTLLGFIFSGFAQNSETYTEKHSNSTRTISRSNGLSSFNVEMRGKIDVTDDDRDIKSISPDGYLEITKITFGSRRRIAINPGPKGLEKVYYEGGTRVEWEPEGRQWLSEILPELVRTSTVAAESRVARFYKKGGVNAVIGEIESMESDYVKSHYAKILMSYNMGAAEYPKIISKIAHTIDSDHYLSEFLENNMDKFIHDKSSLDAVFEACRKMDSDHYKTQVIKEALVNQSPSAQATTSILASLKDMDSDHYKTEVMSALMRKDNVSDATISEMIAATMQIESDHYKTVVLKKALSKPNLSPAAFKTVVESVKEMESDHYKTDVLTDLLEFPVGNDVNAFIALMTETIESDHYRTQVLNTMLKRQKLNPETFGKLLESCDKMDSDHYRSNFLMAASQQPGITDVHLIAILKASTNIDSDHYKTEILTKLAPKVRGGSADLRDAYRACAKQIESEYYYGRALRAIE